MSQHVLEWLSAYHDGELPLNRQRQVEMHLQDCGTCRAELEALERLSSLLKVDSAPEQTPPERFASIVHLRLSRTSPTRPHPKGEQLPRWVLGTPLALIFIWAFLQAALWVTSVILTTDWFLGQRAALFSSWITPESLPEAISSLLLLSTGLLVGTTILWATWMVFWWAWKQNQNLKPSLNQI